MKKITSIMFLVLFLLTTVTGCGKINMKSADEVFSQKLEQLQAIADQYDILISDSSENEECFVFFDDNDISVAMSIVDGFPDYSITYRGDHCDFDDDFYSLYFDITKCSYDVDEDKVREHIETAIQYSESEKTYNYEKPLSLFSSLTMFFNKFSSSDYEISINEI